MSDLENSFKLTKRPRLKRGFLRSVDVESVTAGKFAATQLYNVHGTQLVEITKIVIYNINATAEKFFVGRHGSALTGNMGSAIAKYATLDSMGSYIAGKIEVNLDTIPLDSNNDMEFNINANGELVVFENYNMPIVLRAGEDITICPYDADKKIRVLFEGEIASI